MSAYLDLQNIDMTFATAKGEFNALKDVNLKVQKGEFIALIGHSGCGKSTVLNIVAGLLDASAGVALLKDKEIRGPGPNRAVVFQNHSLLPWLTVYENVKLAVDKVMADKPKAERKAWVMHNLKLVHMESAADKRPGEISGGMKQRVGIARALAMQPDVLLMDEPFGALDALTRAHLQDSVMEIQAELNNTVLMITHDVDEAVLLSDRIVMMTNGAASLGEDPPRRLGQDPAARPPAGATIGEILTVDLPRPRNRLKLAESPHYHHLRGQVLEFLYQKQHKAA